MSFTCPGLDIPRPEHYVPCYRAGHTCPDPCEYVEETDQHVITTRRCPCCGDFRGQVAKSKEWAS